MAEFIKAYCEKSKQYFGLRVEAVGGNQQVTDFYSIETDKAKTLGSTVDVPGLRVAANLRACFMCGNRGVGACECAKAKFGCQSGMGYRFQCLYCRQLRLFAKDEGAEEVSANMVGRTVVLEQGQEVVISAVGSGGLEQILVGVGWDVAKSGFDMDLDSSVLVKNSVTGTAELIYFGNKLHSSGCVSHRGDNIVGGKGVNTEGNDSENIDVYLRKVPADRDELWFVLNIYKCDERNQTLGDVRNMYITLKNGKTGQKLAAYTVNQGMRNKTAIVIGKAYKAGGSWRFKAIGDGIRISNVGQIRAYCHD